MADDHEVFDAEPAQELAADEPRTPLWLPALGALLFSVAAIYFGLLSGDDANDASTPQPPTSNAPASQPPAPSAARDAARPPAAGRAPIKASQAGAR